MGATGPARQGLRHTVEYFAREVKRAGIIKTQGPGMFAAVTKGMGISQDDDPTRRRAS